jgi:hypothetical protein
VTRPRVTVTRERAQEIADVTQKRLTPVGLDGLILCIDDESDRNPKERRAGCVCRDRFLGRG